MNFFEQQDRVRQRTGELIFYFAVAIILILAAVNAAVHLFLSGNGSFPLGVPREVYVWTTAITAGVIIIGTFCGIAQMSGGGAAVAAKLGAKPILPDTLDPDERRLRNVIEEMSIASGVCVPEIYVFQGDELNAFAAGTEPDTAVVAVSAGLLKALNREELQGVVAHEFSHIFNGDMRLNVRLIGLLNGIVMIAVIGRILARTRGKKNPLPVLGILLMAIGYAGVFMSRIIKSAISRQREFLADASAVQFTRNPHGLLGALAKIGRGTSFVSHPKAEELSHLFFAQGFSSFLDGLFATHPPLKERIHAIDPSYRPELAEPSKPVLEGEPTGASFLGGNAAVVTPPAIAQAVASPTSSDVEQAAAYLAGLPRAVTIRLGAGAGAVLVVYGALLSQEEEARKTQLEILAAAAEGAEEMRRALQEAGVSLRLPLLELAIPALRLLAVPEKTQFLEHVKRLVRADNRINWFEFASEILLTRNLDPEHAPPAGGDLRLDAMCLLSCLAYAGAAGREEAARAAFQRGLEQLGGAGAKAILTWDQCGPEAARLALLRLASARPLEKMRLVCALTACVSADGVVGVDEWELLRTVCQCLGCPTPILPPGEKTTIIRTRRT